MTAPTPNKVTPVMGTRRGRPSEYSREEDAIILKYTASDECNEQLKAAGFEPRTPAALASRRDLLRKKMVIDADLASIRDLDDELSLLGTIRAGLSKRLDELVEQHDRQQQELEAKQAKERGECEKRIAAVNARIIELIDE